MKYVVLFLLFVAVGVAATIWYDPAHTQSTDTMVLTSPTPVPSFSIKDPPTDSLQGIMKNSVGDISWQSRTATEPALLTSPVSVRQGELIKTAKDAGVTIEFSDGCSVDVGSEASVDFLQTLPGHIVMRQDEGVVLYNAGNNCPLSVRTRRMLTVVDKGTIAISLDSESDLISVRVRKGSAKTAYNDSDNVSTVINVSEGERFLFDNVERDGQLLSN